MPKKRDALTSLYEISRYVTTLAALNKQLDYIVQKTCLTFNSDISFIYVINHKHLILASAFGHKKLIRCLNEKVYFKDNYIWSCMHSEMPLEINVSSKGISKKDSLIKNLSKKSISSILAAPLVRDSKNVGVLVCASKKSSYYSNQDAKALLLFANQATIAIERMRLFDEIKTNYVNIMTLLIGIINAKDNYTESHSESVMRLSLGIADYLKLSERQKAVLKYASLLHDIGKVGIDTKILKKPAPLTQKEWVEIKKHPQAGVEIIKKAGFLNDLLPAILYHHVRYQGGGYPSTKKKGDAIPLEARILAVADAYESMTSTRPYRKCMRKQDAIKELKRCSGTQFDPKIVKAFLKYLRRFENVPL